MATNLALEQMKQIVRDDFYDHDGPGGKPTGVDGDEHMMANMHKVMPDLHLTIEEMIAEGDKVVCRNIWRWTDASGKRMQFQGFVLWRFEGDKIAERWATVTPPSDSSTWSIGPDEKTLDERAS